MSSEEQQNLNIEDVTDEPEDFAGAGNDNDEDYDGQNMGQDAEDFNIAATGVYKLNEEVEVPGTQGNVFMTLLKEGSSKKRPVAGNKCTVHYVGRLGPNDTDDKFDSSRDRNDPFEFTVGSGVIKGWSYAACALTKGSRALFKIHAPFAYGQSGAGGKIKPGATLWFDIEMIDFSKNQEDVSEKRDKTVLKIATLTNAEKGSHEFPSYEADVTLAVSVFKNTELDLEEDENKNAKPNFEKLEWKFEMGTIDLPSSLDRAICSTKKGETNVFIVRGRGASEAYAQLYTLLSADGKAVIANEAEIPLSFLVKVAVHELATKKTWGFKNQDKLDQANLRKNQGNDYFIKQKDLPKALKKYERALMFVSEDYGIDNDELLQKASELRTAIRGNIAQVNLTLGNTKAVIEQCDKILEEHPDNSKALFRKAKALNIEQEWDEAEKLLKQILAKEPENADAVNTLADVVAKKKAFNQKQKQLYGKMFG